MKAAKRKILPLFWLLVSVFQLPFAAQLAPAKSIPGLENRVWKIFPLAAQTHQVSQLQIAEMQRERAPPQVKEASDDVLAPESGATAVDQLSDPYSGIKQASQYLQDMGVPRPQRVQILQSFDPADMVVEQAGDSEFGLRYFSDPSRPGGSYLFDTFPASRESLAIKPDWNTMAGFTQYQIRPGATFLEGTAAPQGPYLPGGQLQKFILDWRNDLLNPDP